MGVDYSAYIFVGAEVPDSHFYEVGDITYVCSQHGKQLKRFCGDCGRQCDEVVEQLWTPEMLRAAESIGKTPEEIWDEMDPDGGKYFSGSGQDGGFGRWRFGYENDIVLWGIAIAHVREDYRFDNREAVLTQPAVATAFDGVKGAFKTLGIELPVQMYCIQDCG